MFAVPNTILIFSAVVFFYTANCLYANNDISYQIPVDYYTEKSVIVFGDIKEGDSFFCIHLVTNNFHSQMPNTMEITNPVKYSNGIGTPNGAKSVSSTEALKNLLWERAENFKSIISPHTRHQLLQLFTPQPLSWRQKMAVRFNVQINENERVANNITRCVRWISWEDFRRKYSSNKENNSRQTNDEIFQFLWSLSPLEFEWLKKIFLTSYQPNQAFLHNNLSKLFSLIIKK